MSRIAAFSEIAADNVMKARLVDARILELGELRSARIARVLEEYAGHIRLLLADVREVMYVLFYAHRGSGNLFQVESPR